MPNLEKYLSSRFAFSSNQADNMCKYCEKFIPKSMSQHYRYCTSKRDFDIKNGIQNNESNLLESSTMEYVVTNIELTIPPSIQQTNLSSLESTTSNKERPSRKTKK